jgi:hypothetical protein
LGFGISARPAATSETRPTAWQFTTDADPLDRAGDDPLDRAGDDPLA